MVLAIPYSTFPPSKRLQTAGTWIALEESYTEYEMKEVALYGSGGESSGWVGRKHMRCRRVALLLSWLGFVGVRWTRDQTYGDQHRY